MLVDSFEPQGFTQLAKDSIFMMPHLGVLASVHSVAAMEVFERDCLVRLGWSVAAKGEGKWGRKCFSYRVSGAVVAAVDLLMAGQVDNAFCNVRPPGHHAKRQGASGFCIFNNVAVGAAHALDQYGLERVAILDFDVHHGDGTQDIFQDDGRVLFCSTFQHPFYPHSGADSGNAHIINVPLPAGSDGESFRAAVSEHWLPALENFAPQMLLVSAGTVKEL